MVKIRENSTPNWKLVYGALSSCREMGGDQLEGPLEDLNVRGVRIDRADDEGVSVSLKSPEDRVGGGGPGQGVSRVVGLELVSGHIGDFRFGDKIGALKIIQLLLNYFDDVLDRSLAPSYCGGLDRAVTQIPPQEEDGREGRVSIRSSGIDVGDAEWHAVDGGTRRLDANREVRSNVHFTIIIAFPVIQIKNRIDLVVGWGKGDEDLAAGVFERLEGSLRWIDLFADYLDFITSSDHLPDLCVGQNVPFAQEGFQPIVKGSASSLEGHGGGTCEERQDGGAKIDQRVEGGQIVVTA